MNTDTAAHIFDCLSAPTRLGVYRLLVRHGLEGLVAGEIATALDLPPNKLSFHLKALHQAGLVTTEQQGRFQRYRAHIPRMLETIAFLTEECCAGHPEQCAVMRAGSACRPEVLPPLPAHIANK